MKPRAHSNGPAAGAERPPRIVVRGPNWVGDAVMATPVLAHMRRIYPKAHIVLLVRPWVAAVYEHNPHVDELWVEDDGASSRGLLRAARRVRAGSFQIGLVLPNAFRSALLLMLGGVGYRVGYATGHRSLLLHRAVPVEPELLQTHLVYYYLHLAEALGGKAPGAPKLELYPGEIERGEMARLLAQLGLDRGQPLVGIAPGSMNSMAKRWPAERFAALADRLHKAAGAQILLLGSPREKDVLERVAALCRTPAHNLADKVNLGQSIALCERLAGLVCNDAGSMHVAAAMHVPTVAIFGATDWSRTYPFSNVARIVRHEVNCSPCLLRECPVKGHPCMTGVEVEQVAEAFKIAVQSARRPLDIPPEPIFG